LVFSSKQKEKKAKELYSGDLKDQTKKRSSLIKSISLDFISFNFLTSKRNKNTEDISSISQDIRTVKNIKRVKSDFVISRNEKNTKQLKKTDICQSEWGLKLHNSLKSLNPSTKLKTLQMRIIQLERCKLCDKNYNICINNKKCSDVFRLVRALSNVYTTPTSILRLLYKIRSINIWVLKLQKAFLCLSTTMVRKLLAATSEIELTNEIDCRRSFLNFEILERCSLILVLISLIVSPI
jgi:hypothetical protein